MTVDFTQRTISLPRRQIEKATVQELACRYGKVYANPCTGISKILPSDAVLMNPSNERCKPQYQKIAESNEKLYNHFSLAKEIIEYAQQKVPYAANFHSRDLQITKKHAVIYRKANVSKMEKKAQTKTKTHKTK